GRISKPKEEVISHTESLGTPETNESTKGVSELSLAIETPIIAPGQKLRPDDFLKVRSIVFPPAGLEEALEELDIHIDSAMLRLCAEKAAIAANSDVPILLLGETGTGKERFAQLIHRLSTRCGKEMIAINCAAIPKDLAESYLFGHMKGAFTGATSDK